MKQLSIIVAVLALYTAVAVIVAATREIPDPIGEPEKLCPMRGMEWLQVACK